jgi:hypothetical protein
MRCTTPDGGRDVERFENLVETVTHGSFWRLERAASPREAAERAAEGDPVVRFTHPGTDAVLEAQFRPGPDAVCDLALFVSLDPNFAAGDAYFTGSLAAAHRSIAEKYATELVVPQADTDVLLTATVPSDADEVSVRSTVEAVSATALEAARLHRDICEPMAAYVSAPCTRSPTGDT